MKPTKLIATYARVSTSNQENEGTIETQLSAVNKYAEEKGYTIVKRYQDNGWSGDTLIRPSLDQLRQDAKSKLWEGVLIYDPDRLARRYSYQELVTDELKEAGIEVMFVTISAPENNEDKIIYGVRGLFAEYERTKIAERFRLGKLRKIKNGELLVSEALYGYKYIPRNENTAGHYEIDEHESVIINQIFNFVANDKMTLRGVVKKLQELNIKPRKSKRGVWNVSTLRSQIINTAYIGEAHWGSSYAVVPNNPVNTEKYRKVKKSSRKIKPIEDWYIIPIPPIIDKDLFDRANLQLKENFKNCQRNKKNEYLLGNRIYCDCGCRRNGEGIKNGKHLYYRCSSRVHSFPLKTTCTEKGINARIADEIIFDKLAKLMSSPELMQKQAERWLKSKNTKQENNILDIPNTEKQIKKLKEEEDRYNKAYGAGVLEIDKLKEYTTSIKEKISELRSKINRYNEDNKEIAFNLPKPDEILAYSIEATQKLKNLDFAQKRDIVLNIVDKVTGNQEKLTVTGYLPIKSSSNYEYKSISRYRRPSKRWQINIIQRNNKKGSSS